MTDQQHPLQNQANWNKPLTFVVPVEVTVMVDDPTNPSYKGLAEEKVVRPALNELRSILKNMDKTGKQLFVRFRDIIMLPEFEEMLKKNSGQASADSTVLTAVLAKLAELEKKVK